MFEAATISEFPSVLQRIESCLADVSVWLAQRHLSLNSGLDRSADFGLETYVGTVSDCFDKNQW